MEMSGLEVWSMKKAPGNMWHGEVHDIQEPIDNRNGIPHRGSKKIFHQIHDDAKWCGMRPVGPLKKTAQRE